MPPAPTATAPARKWTICCETSARAGELSRTGDRSSNDAQRGVRESNDSGPPAEYQDLFNAFQQSAARGK